MKRSDWLLVLQGIGITLGLINAGLAAVIKDPVVTLVAGAVFGGYSFVIQHIGNQSQPEK